MRFGNQLGNNLGIAKRRIFEIFDAIFKGQLLRGDLKMQHLRLAHAAIVKRPGLGDVEHFQNHEALGHRRLLIHGGIAIGGHQRLQPLANHRLQVFLGEQPAFGFDRGADLFGNLTGIKAGAALARNLFEYVG